MKLKKSPTPPSILRALSECLRNISPHIWHVGLLVLHIALQEVSSCGLRVVRLNKPQQSRLLSNSCRVLLLKTHHEALMTSACLFLLIARHEQEIPNWKMKTKPRMIKEEQHLMVVHGAHQSCHRNEEKEDSHSNDSSNDVDARHHTEALAPGSHANEQ